MRPAQQANAQGITWIASSGDAGAAACDVGSYPASQGLTVSFPASLPEVTAVGGTEFNDAGEGYWMSYNGPDYSSAVGYIPEVGWNDSSPALGLRASGGGASALYTKPSWQVGAGVPNDNARDVPDLAFNASGNHDPYVVISGGNLYSAGGTSLSAPIFAGTLALTGQGIAAAGGGTAGFGNVNPALYAWAADSFYGPIVFHDITSGNKYQDGNIETIAPIKDLPQSSISSIAQTSNGSVWLGTSDSGLLRINDGRVSVISKLPHRKINALLAISEKDVWIGTDRGTVRWNGSAVTTESVPRSLQNTEVLALLADRRSNVWVGTRAGLVAIDAGGHEILDDRTSPDSGAVTAMFEDREGNVWTGRKQGIERFRESIFKTYDKAAGLPSDRADRSWRTPMAEFGSPPSSAVCAGSIGEKFDA